MEHFPFLATANVTIFNLEKKLILFPIYIWLDFFKILKQSVWSHLQDRWLGMLGTSGVGIMILSFMLAVQKDSFQNMYIHKASLMVMHA